MRRLTIIVLVTALLGIACTVTIRKAGEPSASPKASSSPRPSPIPTPDPVSVATADIQEYWEVVFPALYGDTYEEIPPDRIFRMGEPGVTAPPCNRQAVVNDDWIDNAFYCLGDNYIAYDARPNGLITQLTSEFGTASVAAVFAHEWGHAIQDRAGHFRVVPIYAELQADCFAGAWVADAAEDRDDPFDLRAGDLDSILGAILAFRDAPGSHAGAGGAHGSGFDRVSAFQDGYEDSAQTCVPYFDEPPIITEIPFASGRDFQSGGNIAPALVLPSSVEMLNDFYSKVTRKVYTPIKVGRVFTYDPEDPPTSLPDCAGEAIDAASQLENQVFVCHANRYVVADVAYLQRVYEEIGDFGVATLLSGPWASYVQELQGVADPMGEATTAADDCYTGAFARALFNEQLESKTIGNIGRETGSDIVSPSAGDLDEAIAAFIDSDQVQGASGDEVFARVDAFREGFLEGLPVCKSFIEEA